MRIKIKPFDSIAPAELRRFEICILAGGLSSRMGRDKSRLRLGGQSLLGHIRAMAKAVGLPCRIIRRDLIRRCGPLGGLYTALMTSRTDATLFLSCDMPFVTPDLLQLFLRKAEQNETALFAETNARMGFPILLFRCAALPVLQTQLEKKAFSIQRLARTLRSQTIRPGAGQESELFNINTPEDLMKARALWRDQQRKTA